MTHAQANSLRRLRTRGRIYTEIGRRKFMTFREALGHASDGALVALPFLLLLASVAWVMA